MSEEDRMSGSKILARKNVNGIIKFLLKPREESYLHVFWVTEEQLTNSSRMKSSLTSFLKRCPDLWEDNEPLFDPEYTQIERFIAKDQDKDDGVEYLVKWRSLNYDECTWELMSDLEKYFTARELEEHINIFKRNCNLRIGGNKHKKYQFKRLDTSPTFKDDLTLRNYQLTGLNWLLYNCSENRNCILADEMGLGKTMQTIACLQIVGIGPNLIIAPLSTLRNWQREIETWTDFNVVLYSGNQDARQIIRDHEFCQTSKLKPPYKFHILVTNYETLLLDMDFISLIKWGYVVIDEGHRLKNRASKVCNAVREIKAAHKILLTGTPLQNDLEELWSLLNVLEPNQFPNVESFLEKYGELAERSQVEALQKTLKPYLLRRTKEDVEKELPTKEETIVEVELTPAQKQYYRAIIEKNRDFLQRGKRATRRNMNLINIFMEIRKVCNHPFLIKGAEESLVKENNIMSDNEDKVAEYMITASSKLWVLDKLLTRLFYATHSIDNQEIEKTQLDASGQIGNKVLIFSQMIGVLDILEDYLIHKGWNFERLDGTCNSEVRQKAIDHFEREEDCRIMLLSTRAGGVGLNLVSANVVIIYDSDFNPQNDLQAQSRCHRIGQSRNVKVYRLITKNTYERYMMEIASKKLGLEQAIMRNMGETDDEEKRSNADEIEKLLKYGAYYLFMNDDNDNETNQNQDIDYILANYSRTVTYSNTSFSTDVNIDDQDFWIKILPKYVSLADLMARVDNVPEHEQEKFVDVVQSIINDSDRNHDVTLMYQLLQKIVTNFSEKYREWARSIMNERGKRKRTSRMVIDNNHSNDSSEEEEEYRQETDDESEDFSEGELDEDFKQKTRKRIDKKISNKRFKSSIEPIETQLYKHHASIHEIASLESSPQPVYNHYNFHDLSPYATNFTNLQIYEPPSFSVAKQKRDPLAAINAFIREKQEPSWIIIKDDDDDDNVNNF